ncbi:ATPase PAAT [Sphaerodactylus townsendi]|uniref:ATPase PAAT n=1 Tax=Sphaerodactylus townsendi TaxID=933632 RepID=UPI00202735EF|nr:ATPase PAAT [Sphaerodactylus townsendi]
MPAVAIMANSGGLATTSSSEKTPGAVPRRPRISASSSWKCRGGLAAVLRLVAEEEQLGAGELWGPSLNGENVVVLEGCLSNENIAPCFLYLHCDPHGSEEIMSLGIISEARNMEVYIEEEYYATGRGEKVLGIQNGSKNDQVTLYKKHLKLECPTTSCKVKLLSIKEKHKVLISRILVQVSMKPVPDFSAIGSGIDLDRVQSIMESMGSKLSPGAQQLLDMVHFQQKNGLSFGSKLPNIFERTGFGFKNNHAVDGLQKASDLGRLNHLPSGPAALKFSSTAGEVPEDLKTYSNINKQTSSTDSALQSQLVLTSQHNSILSQNDFKGLVSSFLQEQANETSNASSSTFFLPFLQTVCGQVNRLRIDETNEHHENNSGSEDHTAEAARVEQQPACLYVEEVISKRMELMEKKLTNYIDLRMQKLQEQLDTKVAAIMGLLQNSKNITRDHDPAKEGNSSGNT